MKVFNNFNLASLTGFNNVTEITGSLEISGNENLAKISGLNNLSVIGGHLNISNNNQLTVFPGLNKLTTIGGYLYIYGNPVLASFTGLENLSSVRGYFEIKFNDVLTNVSALDNLSSIGGHLTIYKNDALSSLSGFDHVGYGSISDLVIQHNHLLSYCEVQSVCDYLADPNGYIQISNNAPGCNNQEEVENACGIVGMSDFRVPGSGFRIEVNPNPAGRIVDYQFGIVDFQRVTLKIFDLYGREIRTLVDESKSPGEYTVRMDVSALTAGVYLVRLQAGGQSVVRKLIVQ
jgi:hypothetical protein